MQKQKAVIFDIDETVANKSKQRDFREYDKVDLDTPITPTIAVLRLYFQAGYKIIFITSRREICREKTVQWLNNNIGVESELFMRQEKQSKKEKYIKSEVVKMDIYNRFVKDLYDVEAVFEDRQSVIEMWREQGLYVLNCRQNNEIY
jgi:hydroxymethylpyrimidine pyrophosphatase-like HAD family hydrolase